jgi:hypothetical protein
VKFRDFGPNWRDFIDFNPQVGQYVRIVLRNFAMSLIKKVVRIVNVSWPTEKKSSIGGASTRI